MMSDKKLRAVLWDVDNTLIMSGNCHDKAVLQALNEFALPNYPSGVISALDIQGRAWDESWLSFGGSPEQLDQFEDRVASLYLNDVRELLPRGGAIEMVHWLHARGIPQAVVSNSRKRIIDANLHHIGLGSIIKTRICREDYINAKPAPDPYLCAAELLGIDPSLCMAVEDSPRGAMSAKVAGAVVVYWPLNRRKKMDIGDYYINSLNEIDWNALFN